MTHNYLVLSEVCNGPFLEQTIRGVLDNYSDATVVSFNVIAAYNESCDPLRGQGIFNNNVRWTLILDCPEGV